MEDGLISCIFSFRLIDEEQPEELRSIFGWEQYNDLASIYSWLDEQLEKYSNVLTNYDFGKSYENRTLRAVKLSYKKVGFFRSPEKCLRSATTESIQLY